MTLKYTARINQSRHSIFLLLCIMRIPTRNSGGRSTPTLLNTGYAPSTQVRTEASLYSRPICVFLYERVICPPVLALSSLSLFTFKSSSAECPNDAARFIFLRVCEAKYFLTPAVPGLYIVSCASAGEFYLMESEVIARQRRIYELNWNARALYSFICENLHSSRRTCIGGI